MRALDLFCGGGGTARGLLAAGFSEVVGIDLGVPRDSRRTVRGTRRAMARAYPGTLIFADALRPPVRLSDFSLVWASPPCQRYTRVWAGREHRRGDYPDLVEPVRALIRQHPMTVIENVPGAPLRSDLVLTGSQFDLDIVRDRVFELSWPAPFSLAPLHARRVGTGELACIAGCGGSGVWHVPWRNMHPDLRRRLSERNSVSGWRDAMGIGPGEMTRDQIREAVPPAYAAHIGRAAIAAMRSGV